MRYGLAVVSLVALLAFEALPAAADKSLRGTHGPDVLKGGNGDDVLRGKAGRDRLFGRGGDDRLVGGSGGDRLVGGSGDDLLEGGSGKDQLGCGSGEDRVYSSGRDRVAASCEYVNGRLRQPEGGGGGGGGPQNCRYFTRTQPVLQPNGTYEQQVVVVYECDGVERSCPPKPDSSWTPRLLQRNGFWFHYGGTSQAPVKALYRFVDDETCGYRRGTRTHYPTGDLSYGQTYPFIWTIDGDVLTVQFTTGYVETIRLLGYDPAEDRIDRTVNGEAGPPWYGCASPYFPGIYYYAGLCP
jgi:hemolysin type calcium-binding protein